MKRAPRGWLLVALGVAGAVHAASLAPPEPERLARYQRPAAPPFPSANAWTPERAELGRLLFFDPRLSGAGVTSCATCHNPGLAWGDGLPRAIGHGMKQLARRTPTVLNLAWCELYFWDGRAASLEDQALGPIASPDEMNLSLDEMVRRVASIPGYAPLFAAAYPGEPVSERTVAKAIATFERTVVSGRAPFDAWVAGDADAISPEAQRGFALFEGKANCATCHAGWRFTDDAFHDIGLPGDDLGRGKHLPGIGVAQHAFKTPTLRNATRRAPYMHDGSEATLADVIELYDVGGRVRRPSLSSEIQPLALTPDEKRDLVAFLATLTSDDAPIAVPALPR